MSATLFVLEPVEDYHHRPVEEWMKAHDAQWARLRAEDDAAMAAGTLYGRVLSHQYADGSAVYQVVKVNKRTVRAQVVHIGDAWVLPAWGETPTLPHDADLRVGAQGGDKMKVRIYHVDPRQALTDMGRSALFGFEDALVRAQCYALAGEVDVGQAQGSVALESAWMQAQNENGAWCDGERRSSMVGDVFALQVDESWSYHVVASMGFKRLNDLATAEFRTAFEAVPIG